MPCRDDWADEDARRREADRCDMLARIACELCDMLERHDLPIPLGEAADWWKEHKKADKQRRKREREEAAIDSERKAALKKLSKKEQRLLGLLDE